MLVILVRRSDFFQLGILMDVLVGNLWRDNYRYVVKNVFSKDTIFSRT